MADETPDTAAPTAPATGDATPKKAKSRPWILYLAVIEVVLGMGFVYVFLPSQSAAVGDEDWKETAVERTRLVPDLIVNLGDEGAKRILRISAHVKYISSEDATDAADAAMSAEGVVEDVLVGLLSNKLLRQVQGRPPQLKQQVIDELNRVIFREARRPEGAIEGAEVVDVLFPQWIIQ